MENVASASSASRQEFLSPLTPRVKSRRRRNIQYIHHHLLGIQGYREGENDLRQGGSVSMRYREAGCAEIRGVGKYICRRGGAG